MPQQPVAQLGFSAKLPADPPAAGALATSGRTIDEWKLLPGRENHFLDCAVLATVAASAAGITAVGAEMAPERQRRRVEEPKPVATRKTIATRRR